MIVEENKYRFKLEPDVATGIESFPMRTLSFGYKTLKMLRQAAARKKERYFVLGERKYIQNDKGEYEPFAVFGTTIVPLSQLMARRRPASDGRGREIPSRPAGEE